MVTSTNQPTDQQGEYRAICLFRKLENRKKAEICICNKIACCGAKFYHEHDLGRLDQA